MNIAVTLLLIAVICFGIAELFGRSKHLGRWWMFSLMVGAFFVPGIIAFLFSPQTSERPTKKNDATFWVGVTIFLLFGIIGLIPAFFVGFQAFSIPLAFIILGSYLIQLGRGMVVNRKPKQYFNFQKLNYFTGADKGLDNNFNQIVDELKTSSDMIYYLVENGKQSEPYNFEQIREKRIKANDLIWRIGLDNWVEASQLNEIRNILVFNAPPIPSEYSKPLESTIEDANHAAVKIESFDYKASVHKSSDNNLIALNVYYFKLKRYIKRLAYFVSVNIVQILLFWYVSNLRMECSSCGYDIYGGVIIFTFLPIVLLTFIYAYKVLFNLYKLGMDKGVQFEVYEKALLFYNKQKTKD